MSKINIKNLIKAILSTTVLIIFICVLSYFMDCIGKTNIGGIVFLIIILALLGKVTRDFYNQYNK